MPETGSNTASSMTITFDATSYLHGFEGGLLIGLAAALMLLGLGRVAGVSGLLANATRLSDGTPSNGTPWLIAMAFVLGLPLGAFLLTAIAGPVSQSFAPLALIIPAGVLVGFGTRLGSGCTSGHGICGLARLSPRSLAATLTFMAAGILTVAIANHFGGGW